MGDKLIITACLALLLAFISLASPSKAYAHGTYIEYSSNTSIEITAKYDTGEPMAGAQVTVYTPDDPATPWSTGVCDEEGRFSFVPDQDGTWGVRVRLSGHGDFVHIPVGEGMATSDEGGGYSVLQVVLMSVCVVWGLIGTALYISRRKT